MFSNKKHSRRYFIKSVFAGLTIGFVVLWDKMVFTQKKIVGNKTISIPLDTNKQISFNDEFIVINKDANTKVFSSRCTHLGCKINKSKNNELLCPCHGSTFDLNGNPTKGPAIKPLEQKDFEISNSTININI